MNPPRRKCIAMNTSRIAFAVALGLCAPVAAGAQTSLFPQTASLCSTTVPLPSPAAGRGAPGAPAGRGAGGAAFGRGGPPAQSAAAELPRLVKVKDDVYVIQNVNNTVAEIGQFGGNVTIYLTDDGVILFDSKNERTHDDIVAKVKSLTNKPIKYVALTHNHGDHAGGAAKMQAIGATLVISQEDREQLAKANQPGLPQVTYHGQGQLFLGGKEVQLREYCGHTRGDTVAYLPAAGVLVAGDLVTTPDTIPQIVNYGDGGNWTDMTRTLDELATISFDVLVGGHGPLLTRQEFLKHRDKVFAIRDRVRALSREGKTQDEVTAALIKEFNYGNGPAAGQIGPMMQELK
jgi:glyoxylase-like metal-dependent hydrolase (beta-lactamase superfamily II)